MYTIDNIALENDGLYISKHQGQVHLPLPKQQLFTLYGKEGYQITRRKANELDLRGFIIASDINDFIAKTTNLRTLFSDAGVRALVLDSSVIHCFSKEGFKVDKVRVIGSVYANFQIKLTIV